MTKLRKIHSLKIENLKLKIARDRRAFTLIEMLVVVAITAIFATMGTVFLGSYRGSQNLKKTLDEVASLVQATQKRSITQDNGSEWNVRFSNTTSSGSQYFSFSGASFSTSSVDRTYGLARGIVFSSPFSGSTYDALFAPITGALPEKKIISMIDGKGDGLVSDLVLSSTGRTTKRNENGLVGYWHLDDATGTVASDASGLGNKGTLVNSPTWQSGVSCVAGACVSFNGTNNQITIPLVTNAVNNISLSAWMYWSGTSANGLIAYNGNAGANGFGILIGNGSCGMGGRISILLGGILCNALSASYVPPANTWVHLVATRDAGTWKLYVNGALAITGVTQTPNIPTGWTYIGTTFPGSIDEVRFYNRALSASEIASQYNDLR